MVRHDREDPAATRSAYRKGVCNMTAEQKVSPRQELDTFLGTGRLRDVAERARLSEAAQDLLVNIVARYCEPRRRRKR